jgi:hypothetical protein
MRNVYHVKHWTFYTDLFYFREKLWMNHITSFLYIWSHYMHSEIKITL